MGADKRSPGGGSVTPKMYQEIASWWPLLSCPADYAEEAAFFEGLLLEHGANPPRTLLELGSGGGNNASHLKARFEMTLVDMSPGMLAVSRELNPECAHHEGDMRAVRLDRAFDAVFIHDAIGYMATEADLRRALETAFVHCRPGGVAIFVPDHICETFEPSTDSGGHARDGRGLRYLEWTWQPEPGATTYVADYAYLLRSADGSVRVEHDRHVEGLFARAGYRRATLQAPRRPRVARRDGCRLGHAGRARRRRGTGPRASRSRLRLRLGRHLDCDGGGRAALVGHLWVESLERPRLPACVRRPTPRRTGGRGLPGDLDQGARESQLDPAEAESEGRGGQQARWGERTFELKAKGELNPIEAPAP